jgi:hypothetical protein
MKLKQAIEKFGESNPLKIYKYAKTYDDLASINTAFLSGKMSRSCGFADRIYEETFPLVEDFKRLSNIGIISLESQPGEVAMYGEKGVFQYESYNNFNFGIKREWLKVMIETKRLPDLRKIFYDESNPYYVEYRNKYGVDHTNPYDFLKTPLVVDKVGKDDMVLTLQSSKDGTWGWESTLTVGKSVSQNWVNTETECLFDPGLIEYIKEECSSVFIMAYKFGKTSETIAQRLLKNLCKDCGEYIGDM